MTEFTQHGPVLSNAEGTRTTVHTSGRLLLTPPNRDSRSSTRREYLCTLLTPGFVKAADGTTTDWLIPAHVVNRDAHLFDGVASYLDHPEMVGLGWRGEPQVKNLVGVVTDVRYDIYQSALVGVLRLYDEDPNSPGAFVGHIADQILADTAAGLPVPEIGLSAVFYHEVEQDEHMGHRVTQAFTKVESVDIVYSPGAGGYIREALSAMRPSSLAPDHSPEHPVPTGQSNSTLTSASILDTERSTTVPEEPAQTQPEESQEPTQPDSQNHRTEGSVTQDDVLRAVAELASRVGQLTARVESLSADLEGTPEVQPDQSAETLEDLHAQVQHLTRVLTQHESRTTVQGMGDPPAQREALPARFSLASPLDELQTAWDWIFGVDGAPLPNPELRRTDYLYRLLSGDLSWTGVFNPREALAAASTTTLADMAVNAMNKVIIALYDRLDGYG